ncbi:hypothetical protein C8R43DRAFT_1202086 [Mycena crocata]|nr:hypothetical protein C8R43DRAFT_1202086 [Mycena crocata]
MFKCSTPSSSSKSLQRRPWSYQRRSYPMLVSPLQNCTGGFKIKHRLDSGPEISMRGFKSDQDSGLQHWIMASSLLQKRRIVGLLSCYPNCFTNLIRQVVVLVRSHLPRPFNSTHSDGSKEGWDNGLHTTQVQTQVLTLLTPVLGWLSSDRLVDFGPPEVWMSGWVRRNYALGWNTETMDVYPQEDGIVVGYIQSLGFGFQYLSMLNLCSEFSACSIIMIHTSTWNESESAQVGLGFTDGVFFLWLGPGRRLFDRAPLTLGTPGLCDNYNCPRSRAYLKGSRLDGFSALEIKVEHWDHRDSERWINCRYRCPGPVRSQIQFGLRIPTTEITITSILTSKPSRNDRQIKLDAYLGTLYCSKPHWFSEGSSWYDDWLGFTAIIPVIRSSGRHTKAVRTRASRAVCADLVYPTGAKRDASRGLERDESDSPVSNPRVRADSTRFRRGDRLCAEPVEGYWQIRRGPGRRPVPRPMHVEACAAGEERAYAWMCRDCLPAWRRTGRVCVGEGMRAAGVVGWAKVGGLRDKRAGWAGEAPRWWELRGMGRVVSHIGEGAVEDAVVRVDSRLEENKDLVCSHNPFLVSARKIHSIIHVQPGAPIAGYKAASMAHPHSTQPPLQPQESMIGPPPSFYDNQWEYPQQHPQGHHQQQQHQLHHGQHGGGFDFAYPAPGTSYDDLLAQFAQYPPQGQQQHVQYHQYEPSVPQNTSNPGTSPSNGHNGAPSTSTPPNPKRKRTSAKKAAAPAPAPPASNSNGYSDNSDSEDGFGGFRGGGGAGISVGMGGLGVRSKGARL